MWYVKNEGGRNSSPPPHTHTHQQLIRPVGKTVCLNEATSRPRISVGLNNAREKRTKQEMTKHFLFSKSTEKPEWKE